jgi:hypothetical protein
MVTLRKNRVPGICFPPQTEFLGGGERSTRKEDPA